MQEDRYFIVHDWMVQAIGNANAVMVFALLYGLCTANGGSRAVTNAYIAERTGFSERWVIQIVKDLVAGGYIARTPGNGRGVPSTYTVVQKGEEECTLIRKKGEQTDTISTIKRVNNRAKKGEQSCTQIINNNKYTTTTKGAGACEGKESAEDMVRRVLTDNEERMAALCMQNSIPPNGTLTETLRPFIEDFILGEKAADTDYYLQDAKEIRRHFACWLRKNKHRVIVNILDKDNDDTGTHTTSENDTGASIQGAVVTGYSQRISRDIERVARSLL